MRKGKRDPNAPVLPARNYTYGAFAPITGAEAVKDQMYKAHKYLNALAEIEIWRRDEVLKAQREMSPDLIVAEERWHAAEAELEDATEEQKKINVKQRGREVAKAAEDNLKRLRAAAKATKKEFSSIRRVLYERPEWKAIQDDLNRREKEKVKPARAASGLYWGTYCCCEDAATRFRKGPPPRFRSWSWRCHHGIRLGVQIQHQNGDADWTAKDLTANRDSPQDGLIGDDSRLRLELHPADYSRPDNRTPGSTRSKGLRAVLWFRVGSDEKRAPVWTRIPIYMHRPLPEGARIKWCYLIRRELAGHGKWSVVFSIEGNIPEKPRVTSGKVAFDVGWRRMKKSGGLRVAMWSGSDGREGEIRLGEGWCGEMERVERIQAERGRLFNEVKDWLVPWFAKHEADIPETMMVSTLENWKSKARLQRLSRHWRDNRFLNNADEDDAIRSLEKWRRREQHLWDYEANLRDQLEAGRRDFYRKLAAQFAKRYETAVFEDMSYSKFHLKPPIERGGDAKTDAAREYVRWACLSVFRESMVARMTHGKVPAPKTTQLCNVCGHDTAGEWDQAELEHTCSECATRWDQDRNASRNILGASGPTVKWTLDPLDGGDITVYGERRTNNRGQRRAKARALANAEASV